MSILNTLVVETQLTELCNTILQWDGVQKVRIISSYGLNSTLLDVEVTVISNEFLHLHKTLFEVLVGIDTELEGKTERMWYLKGFIVLKERLILTEEQVLLEVNK